MSQTLPAETLSGHPEFRPLSAIPGIGIDLRYATPGNFAGRDLYSPHDCAFLHREAATALAASVAWLARECPGFGLLVLDAVRPQRVQEALWESLAGQPELRRYLADPARGSIHSFGMAIDITVTDPSGRELDMGTPFDGLDELSHPALEEGFLRAGMLSQAQVDNRVLLRSAMAAGGWKGITTEWWHFDCGDRATVRATYPKVL